MVTGVLRDMMVLRTVLVLVSLATVVPAQKCVFKFEAAPPKGVTCAALKDMGDLEKDLKAITAKKMVSEIAPAMQKLEAAVTKRVQVEKKLADVMGKVQKMMDDMDKLNKAGAAAATAAAAAAAAAASKPKPGSPAGSGATGAGAKPGPATPAKPVDPGDEKDCAGLKLKDKTKRTGLATIKPPGQPAGMQVWCNMDIGQEPRGWAVILRRESATLDFNKKFTDYEKGFGTPSQDYWIGLKNLQKITAQDEWQLYVSLTDHDGNEAFARYTKFKVSGADYKLTISGFDVLSSAGDSLADSNGIGFSANDKDNDGSKTTDCGKQYQSGWWFNQFCPHPANLNGIYHAKGDPFDSRGIYWREWRQNQNLKKAIMMIQRKRSPPPARG